MAAQEFSEFRRRSAARTRIEARAALEALPKLPLQTVLVRLAEADEKGGSSAHRQALGSLPLVSKHMLAAVQELRLPIGRVRADTVEAAVQQANAPCRAWELQTLDLSECERVRDVSALAGCAALQTLNLSHCSGVRGVSALAGRSLVLKGWNGNASG